MYSFSMIIFICVITLSFCLFVIKNICKVKTIHLKFKVKIDKIKSKANKPFKVNIYIEYN